MKKRLQYCDYLNEYLINHLIKLKSCTSNSILYLLLSYLLFISLCLSLFPMKPNIIYYLDPSVHL